MKLASLRDGTPDGRLVVVSSDLTRASDARHIAPSLSAALDDWEHAGRELDLIARGIEIGAQPVERFHEREALAPLPAAATRIETGGALRHGSGPAFADPRARLSLPDGAPARLHAAIALVTGALPMGVDRDAAGAAIRLVMLAAEIGAGKACLSPVAVTPAALGEVWRSGVVHGHLRLVLNGKVAAEGDPGLDLAALLAEAAHGAAIPAGMVFIAGPLPRGGSIDVGPGDSVTVEMRDPQGRSIFGVIERRPELDGSAD